MQDLERLNDLLLGLYRFVPDRDPACFQTAVLALLGRTIGFDRAWWGIMSEEAGRPILRSSYRFELPDSFEAQWEEVKLQDNLARDVRLRPRVTVNFDERLLRSTPGLALLNETHDLRHALCTSMFLPDGKSFLFVSLFRSRQARGFDETEIRLKQALTPHLYASWRANLLFTLAAAGGDGVQPSRSAAFVDRTGHIIFADAAFSSMVAEGWPSWTGQRLPSSLLGDGALEGRRRVSPSGRRTFRSARRDAGGLTLIELRRTSPLERLTPRESQIARAYADARSHKEVAMSIGISPATVRHHLRVIFEKLGVHEKAALVRLIDRSGDRDLRSADDAPDGVASAVSPIDCLGGEWR